MSDEINRLLKKHAKHFIKTDGEIGMLDGIHYHKNGSIYVCDGHKILAIKNVHADAPHTVHYKTGKAIDGKYPEITRLFSIDFKGCTALNMVDLKKYIELIKVANKVAGDAVLLHENGKLFISGRNPYIGSFNIQIGSVLEIPKIRLNIMYFYQMLNFFKDAKADHVIFSWNKPFSPLSFRSENYEIIILPLRRF